MTDGIPASAPPPGHRSMRLMAVLSALLAATLLALSIVCFFGPYLFWEYGLHFDRGDTAYFLIASILFLSTSFLFLTRIRSTVIVISKVLTLTAAIGLMSWLAYSESGEDEAHMRLMNLVGQEEADDDGPINPAGILPEGEDELLFFFAGDTSRPSDALRRFIKLVDEAHAQHGVDGMFLVGDAFQGEMTPREALRILFREPFSPLLQADLPFYGVLGNHEHNDGFAPLMMNLAELHMEGRGYYDITFGDNLITFIILDSEELIYESEQLFWLKTQLATSESEWNVIVMHKPPNVSDDGHGLRLEVSRLLEETLTESGNVTALISGHRHYYDHSIRNGIHYLTYGATVKESDYDEQNGEGSILRIDDRKSIGYLSVKSERLLFRAIDRKGEVIDEFSIPAVASPALTTAQTGENTAP